MAVGVEGLVLADGKTLVVVHRPAAGDPPRVRVGRGEHRLPVGADDHRARGVTLRNRPGACLHLGLHLPAQAVGVGQADLQRTGRPGGQIGHVDFPDDGHGHRRTRRRPAKGVAVHDCSCRRARQQGGRQRPARVGQQVLQLRRCRVGDEAVQRVTLDGGGRGFAHDGAAGDHAERVVGHGTDVAVRVGQARRAEHPVVQTDSAGGVAQRVAGLGDQQVVRVEHGERLGAGGGGVKRVPKAQRAEEMCTGVSEFLGRVVGCAG